MYRTVQQLLNDEQAALVLLPAIGDPAQRFMGAEIINMNASVAPQSPLT
jgi:hypothetical protein